MGPKVIEDLVEVSTAGSSAQPATPCAMAFTSQLLHADAEVMRKAAALIETHDLDPAGVAHGRAVAETLAGIAPDPEALAAALLLPALEDGCLDLGTIEKRVGTETARLVASAARIAVLKDYRPLGHDRGETRRLRDMLLAIVEDPRALLIRLADQLVRLRAASSLDPASRRALGEETLAVFAPLAGRLGVWQRKWQLEGASLRYVEPPRDSSRYPRPSSVRAPSASATSQGSSPTFGASFRWPASQPRSPTDPNMPTASGTRCDTRASDSIRSTTSWRCASR